MTNFPPGPSALILAFGLILLPVACDSGSTAPADDLPSDGLSATARIYLNAALDIMQASSINRYQIDWPPLRQAALLQAKGAETTRDTYPAIRSALAALGDNHSSFYEPQQVGDVRAPGPILPTPGPVPPQAVPPSGQRLESRVGYVRMPSFSSMQLTSEEIAAHATSYHSLIRQSDTTGMCGWIVDLRTNHGGNMWPMLAGIGPILGEGMVGMFVNPDSVKNYWYYEVGKSLNGSYVLVEVGGVPYELIDPDPAVAVLTGPGTASSGEAQVVAFRGRPNTRSFGEPTYGVPTANSGFRLSDGALLNLTVAWMADRTGQKYGSPMPPDELIPGDPTSDPATDPVVLAAEEWVLQAGACGDGG